MMRKSWRFFLRACAIQLLIYVPYFLDLLVRNGAHDWFQLCVLNTYGRLGVYFIEPFVPDGWAGFGIELLFAPLIGIILFSILIGIVAALLARTNAA